MRRLTYRVYVDAPEETPVAVLERVVEDALEGLSVGAVEVTYSQIDTAEGLPPAPVKDPCGAADRWSCICQPAGLPQGTYKAGVDL